MMKRDPNAARDRIFKKTYLYSHPAFFRYSQKFNEIVGQISTGDPREDAKLMNEPVHVGGTIADMLKLFAKGCPIDFQNRADMVEVYDTIVEHMENWITYINMDPNVKNAPMESLALMEEFATVLYPSAKGFRRATKAPPHMQKRSKLMFGGMSREQQAASQPASTGPTKHTPIMGRLEKLLGERNT